MSQRVETAILFPGQGVLKAGGWLRFREHYPEAASVFREIDDLSLRYTGELASDLLRWRVPRPRLNAAMNLAVYGAAVSVYRALGAPRAVLLGHGSGEITAAVCAGLLSVQQGADVICARSAVLEELAETLGSMVSFGCGESRARQIIDIAGNAELSVAAVNSDCNTVLSGSSAALEAAQRIAAAGGIPSRPLYASYPLHSGLLDSARQKLLSELKPVQAGEATNVFFSATLQRYVEPMDDLADVMASLLTRPVHFSAAVQRLHADGVRVFIECGAMQGIGQHIIATLGGIPGAVCCQPASTPDPSTEYWARMKIRRRAIRQRLLRKMATATAPAPRKAETLRELTPSAGQHKRRVMPHNHTPEDLHIEAYAAVLFR